MDDIISVTITPYTRVNKIDVAWTPNTYYYEKDHLWSITKITSSTGSIVDEYSYTVFGKSYKKSTLWVYKPLTSIKSDIWNTRLYTGREYDRETNLYYLRARYYDANLGRFISRDPIGMRDNVNLYSYVANSPVGYVDRMGREKALLTIYSWREDWYLDDGHSWIEIQKKWDIHSYGLWPDKNNIETWEQILWSGIQTDLELDIKDTRYTRNVEKISILLNKEQLRLLEERVAINIKSKVTWWFWAPWDTRVCSKWATDQWNLIANKDQQLSSRNIIGIGNPNSLADSIIELRNNIWSTDILWEGWNPP
jgi:RHS repeat-associated protein